MTQEELNTILAIKATQETAFNSLLKEIDIPEESKTKIKILFTITQGFAMQLLKNDVASDLEFPETVNQLLKNLDTIQEEAKNQEVEK